MCSLFSGSGTNADSSHATNPQTNGTTRAQRSIRSEHGTHSRSTARKQRPAHVCLGRVHQRAIDRLDCKNMASQIKI